MLPRRMVCAFIKFYQKTLSLDHGPLRKLSPIGVCKYHPTCSEYGYGVIMKFGVVRGTPKMLWRILRCNPWSKGGIDPIPQK
ncbi:MAG: membrane protein insertion efficiency factor YidD [Patescibacteria group bacterium]